MTQEECNEAWDAGFRVATGAHAGLVAAVHSLVNGQVLRDYEFGDDRHVQLMLTLESTLNNYTATMKFISQHERLHRMYAAVEVSDERS